MRAALLLVCGLVREAVELYIHSKLAAFALLLSRLQLPQQHPLQRQALDAWLAEADQQQQKQHQQQQQQQQEWRIGRLLRLALHLEEWSSELSATTDG